MSEFRRILDLRAEARKKSLFLFGPRQTGKTYLLRTQFPRSRTYNLLHADMFLKLSRRPELIREELANHNPEDPIIIDEIQKLPVLLDEAHAMIEERHFRFILTGSSPRKLLRRGANLLGGRARTRHLFPLVSAELGKFDLLRVLNYGSLPYVMESDDPEEDLIAYCGSYLQEEIAAEGAVRRIESFSRFFQTSSLVNGELLNFESVAGDSGVPPRTVREYFSILEDTLIGATLPPYRKARSRKAVATAKFYLFDCGVANVLSGRKIPGIRTELFGKAFEHFIFLELRAWADYRRDRRPLTFWRDRSGAEVDFVIGDEIAVEVKSTDLVQDKHLRGLRAFSEVTNFKKYLVVSLDPQTRTIGKFEVVPYREFLRDLWGDRYA